MKSGKKFLLLLAFSVLIFSVASAGTAPVVTATAPASGTYLKSGASQSITFTVTDSDSPADVNAVIYYSSTAGAKTNKITNPDLNLLVSGICGSTDFSAGASCTYSWTVPSASDGNYFIDVTAKDLSNADETTASSASFVLDSTAPTGSISASVSENDVTVTYSGSDALSPITKYEVKRDSESYVDKGTATSHPFNDLSNGDHNFTVRITDAAGNTFETTSTPATNVNFSAGPSGTPAIDSGTHEEDTWTSNDDPEFTWSEVSGSSIVYRYALNTSSDTTITNSTSDNKTDRSQSYSNIDEGTRWFHVAACNTSGCGPTDHYKILIDNTGPSVPGNLFGLSQSDGSIYLSWDAASDGNSGIDYYVVYRSVKQKVGDRDFLPTDPGVRKFSDITNRNYTDEDGLTAGLAYYYRVQAFDNAGNSGSMSSVKRVLNSANACGLAISFDVPETVKAGALNVKATISNGNIFAAALKIKMPGKSFETIAEADNKSSIEKSYDVPENLAGTASVTLTGKDENGKACDELLEFEVDSIKPEAEILSPAQGADVEGSAKIIVRATDEGSGIEKVSAAIDGKDLGEFEKSGNNFEAEWNSNSKENGEYDLEVTATDKAGNEATVNGKISVKNVDENLYAEKVYVFSAENLESALREAGLKSGLVQQAVGLIGEFGPERRLEIVRTASGLQATIFISVKNSSGEAKSIEVVEVIPKGVASSARIISSDKAFSVLEQDPSIKFDLGEIRNGATLEFSYVVGQALSEADADKILSAFDEFKSPPIVLNAGTESPIEFFALPDYWWIIFVIVVLFIVFLIILVLFGGGAFLLHRHYRKKGESLRGKISEIFGGSGGGKSAEPEKRFSFREKP